MWFNVELICLGFFLIISCVTFPLGWSNVEVRQACGKDVDKYTLGNCSLGWAALMVAGATLLTLLCACLSIKAGKSDRMKASTYNGPRYDTIQLRENQF